MNNIDIINKYVKLANYLTIASMYLKSNFFLQKPLSFENIKDYPTGHWGNAPQINFIYPHLNYYIKRYSLNNIHLIVGSGHAGIPYLINSFLDSSLQKTYKNITLQHLITNIGTANGFRSEFNGAYPNILYAGGELGYSLATSIGYVLKNKDSVIFCLVGDGEAETGSVAASWNYTQILRPETDGVVVPILNLNGYKMGGNSIFSNYSKKQLKMFFASHNLKTYFTHQNHKHFIHTLNKIHNDIEDWQHSKTNNLPIIIFTSKKGDGIPIVDKNEHKNALLLHKNPLKNIKTNPKELEILSKWMRHYFVPKYSSFEKILAIDFENIIPKTPLGTAPKQKTQQNTYIINKNIPNKFESLDTFLNKISLKDKIITFSPDELYSNRLYLLSQNPNCYEILNEQICQAWLWGNAIAGKKGLLISYEGFMPLIDSQLIQYIKFMEEYLQNNPASKIYSLNYLLTSLWWENCYSHQNPTFLNTTMSISSNLINIQFPLNPISAIIGAYKNLNTYNKINIIYLSKRIKYHEFNFEEAKMFIKTGIFEYGDIEEFDFLFFVMGDALFNIAKKLSNQVYQITKLKSKIVYFYNFTSLFNYYNQLKYKKKIFFLFLGYPMILKGLLFDKFKTADISIYGYNNKYCSGSTEEKIEINGININNILSELNH